MADIRIGKPDTEAAVNFWLTVTSNGLMLEAKHTGDNNDQRIAVMDFREGETTITISELSKRNAPNLCAFLHISDGGTPLTKVAAASTGEGDGGGQ